MPSALAEAPPVAAADLVVIEKNAHRLTLFRLGKQIKSYKIALGSNPVGHKEKQGDGRTPEGLYTVDSRNANSSFYRALHISYPNAQDIMHARALGVDPGGDVMIHGIRNGFGWLGSLHRVMDWTKGCVAVTDAEIDEIWNEVPMGTTVEIKP